MLCLCVQITIHQLHWRVLSTELISLANQFCLKSSLKSFNEAGGKNSVQHLLHCCFYYWDLSRKGRILRWLYWKLYWVFAWRRLLLWRSKGLIHLRKVSIHLRNKYWVSSLWSFLFFVTFRMYPKRLIFSYFDCPCWDNHCPTYFFFSFREAKLITYQRRMVWLNKIINLINEWKLEWIFNNRMREIGLKLKIVHIDDYS